MTQDQKDSMTQRTLLLATDSALSIIGEVVDGKANTIAYSAYGHQSAQQDVTTRLGFNGQLREMQTSWYLLGNGYRAYNPRLMRFHSPDSWSPFNGGGLNAYMYCVGDPVNRSDPTGHVSFFDFIFGVIDFFSVEPGARVSGGGSGLFEAAEAIASRAPGPGGRSSTPIGPSPELHGSGSGRTSNYLPSRPALEGAGGFYANNPFLAPRPEIRTNATVTRTYTTVTESTLPVTRTIRPSRYTHVPPYPPPAVEGVRRLRPAIGVVHPYSTASFSTRPSSSTLVGSSTHELPVRAIEPVAAVIRGHRDGPMEPGIISYENSYRRRQLGLEQSQRWTRDDW